MSKYKELYKSPPTLNVVENPKEIVMHTVSVMCDNKRLLTLKKNDNNEFKLYTHGQHSSNFAFEEPVYEIEWAADEGNWNRVFDIVNSGYQKIEKVRSR